MKKILFGVAALGLLGLAGAGLGLKAQDTVEAKADYAPTCIYFQWTGTASSVWGGWGVDPTEIGAHFPGYTVWGGGVNNSADPDEVIKVNGTDYIKYTVPSGATTVVFNIKKWAGDNNQTEDLTIPVNGANCFVPSSLGSGKGNGSWVEMYPEIASGAYLRGGWENGWYPSGQVAAVEDPAGTYTANVVFGASGTMKMVMFDADHKISWIQASSVTIDGVTSDSFKDKDGNVVVSSAARYTVVVSGLAGDQANYVLTSAADPNLTTAITYAEGWMTSFTENCPHTNVGGTVDKVVSTWDAKMTAYAGLDSDVQDYLLDGSTTVDEIIAFHSSYDYIYSHYAGVRALNDNDADFLSRNPGESPAKSTAALVEENNSPVTIVTIACVAGAAVLGLLAMRKRRAE